MSHPTDPAPEAVYRRTDTGWENLSALQGGSPVVAPLAGTWPEELLPAQAALQRRLPWARCHPPYRLVRLPWADPPWPGVHLGDLLTVALPAGPFAGIVARLALVTDLVYDVEVIEAGAAAALGSGWNPDADPP